MKTIYLAGPMDFATTTQMNDWRINANKELKGSFNVLDPVRRPHAFTLTKKEIFNLDMIDVRNSDIILTDCRELNIPSFGTPCEVFYASYILKKSVIGWYNDKYKPTGKGVFQEVLMDAQFNSLKKAINHIKKFYI